MKLFLHKTYLRLIIIIAWCFYPLVGLLLPLLSSWAKNRKAFELKNLTDPAARFHHRADICFEVSSEGELEQVMPLVEYYLLNNKMVELVYSSESVEKKIQGLIKKFPEKLFIYRLPLITFSPFSSLDWVKADILVLCRYDFYPHLILLGLTKKKFVLLSASLKGKKNPPSVPYEFFHLIVCASEKDKTNFEKLLGSKVPLMTLDLRVSRIITRLESAPETLKKISSYLEKLSLLPRSSRIILGSAYPEELKIFENKELLKEIENGKIHICIAPHKLDQDSISNILNLIPKNIPHNLVRDNSPVVSLPGITLMLVPGILCELYSYFGHAFVGGGFLKSVHSLLEPYLAGARVYCGPKTQRSTEFDFILSQSIDSIAVVTNPKDFYDYLINSKEVNGPSDLKDFKVGQERLISFLKNGK